MSDNNGAKAWIAGNWLKIALLVISVVAGYAILQYQVGENKEDIEKHSLELDGIKSNQIIFAEDVEHILEDIEDINDDMDEFAKEQQETHDLLVRVGSAVGVE